MRVYTPRGRFSSNRPSSSVMVLEPVSATRTCAPTIGCPPAPNTSPAMVPGTPASVARGSEASKVASVNSGSEVKSPNVTLISALSPSATEKL